MDQPDPDVRAFLDSLGLGELAGRFAAEDIDGSLLWSLREGDLREMGLTLGQRRRIMARLAQNGVAPPARPADGPAEPDLRRLTVLFCDLVSYTEMTTRLDPDEMRTLLGGYYAAAHAAANSYGGYVAALQGDGVVILFGFPATQHGSADRAIRAGHALLARIRGLSHRLPDGDSLGVAARVGIASGRAIVGFPGGDPGGHLQMVGAVINRAARLQAIARPGMVVVDAATRDLAGPEAGFAELPAETLKGFAQKVAVWQALDQPATVAPRPSPGPERPRPAHAAETARLCAAWARARAGQPGLALVTGEAGIGKTTLMDEIAATALADGAGVLRLSCSALHERDSLRPVLDALTRALAAAGGNGAGGGRARLAPLLGAATEAEITAVAALLGLSGPDLADRASAEQRRARVLGGLAQFIEGTAEGPRLVLIEDVHWIDPTTRELLELGADRLAGRRLLMIATSRDPAEPLWSGRDARGHLPLARLLPDAARDLLERLLGGRILPGRVVEDILTRSDGNALMIATLVRLIDGQAEAGLSPAFEVPASIYESISSLLDSVPSGRRVAGALSVLDMPSDRTTLARVLGLPPRDLDPAMAELLAAGICHLGDEATPRIHFRHNLFRAVTYERLVKSTRQTLHRAAFDTLAGSADEIELAQSGLLAHHAFEGGDHARAAPLALTAAEHALQTSALIEAGQILQQAETALDRLPPGPGQDRMRLRALVMQASLIRARKGIAVPELGVMGRRIRDLARELGETRTEMIALNGLYSQALVGADHARARSWAQDLRAAAEASQDQTFGMIATRALGVVAFHTGALTEAEGLLRQALAAYDEGLHLPLAHAHGYDHAEISAAFLSMALWVRGDLRGSAEFGALSVSHSRRIGHAHSLAQALMFQAMLQAMAGDAAACAVAAHEGKTVAALHGLAAMQAISGFFAELAVLMGRNGPPRAEDLDALHRHHAAFRAIAPRGYEPAIGSLLVSQYLAGNDPERAEAALRESRAAQDRTGEVFAAPELRRQQARLLVARGQDAAARAEWLAAFDAAQSMGAALYALRVACDLVDHDPSARALRRLRDARARLVSVTGENRDLRRAQDLLAMAGAD